MKELGGSNCDICGAIVSRALMRFHLDWHQAQDGRGARFFEKAADEPSLDQLLTVIAALRDVATASARPDFVADLRARLVALALKQPIG